MLKGFFCWTQQIDIEVKNLFDTFTIDNCVKDLSDLIFEIGESCSPPLLQAAGEIAFFFACKSLQVKNRKQLQVFF
jgi:hypothetical protein